MIKNLNESIKFNENAIKLFEELEVRPELGCSGNACGAVLNACGLQA